MHSQELPGRIGSGMSCVTLQTITSVFKYPIKCRDQFCKKKKKIVEKENLLKNLQIIINTNNSKPGKIAASSIGVTVHSNISLPIGSNGFRADR